MTDPITPTADLLDTAFSAPLPAMQSVFDMAGILSLNPTGGLVIAVFVIYWLFEFLYIVLDKRRRRYS
jgi:hypothetical protein